MTSSVAVLFAGMPPELGTNFVSKFNNRHRHIQILTAPSLKKEAPYTADYVEKLYGSLGEMINKKIKGQNQMNFEIVLLYAKKGNGNIDELVRQFKCESLLVPLQIDTGSLVTKSQRNRAINNLVNQAHRAINRASKVLSVIAEEVTTRDNRTCLLLPCRNFGRDFRLIMGAVHAGVLEEDTYSQFSDRIRRVSNKLSRKRLGKKKFFRGRSGIVFRSPGTSRHGLAPSVDDTGHQISCGVRGRFRFGAPYDPHFHYDCDIPTSRKVSLYHCHGEIRKVFTRSHVNIAPNDNTR